VAGNDTGRGRPERKGATLKDVAASAQVSLSTASRALRGQGYVAQPVKDRVLVAAQALRYVPNNSARFLRVGRSREVGVLISDLVDPFYAEVASGIESELRNAGYQMVLATHNGNEGNERRAARSFLSMQLAGAIVIPLSPDPLRELTGGGIIVVQTDRIIPQVATDAVIGANDRGGFAATEYLLALGHRHIALLIDEAKWTTGAGRLDGFRRAHQEAGLPVDEHLIVYTGSYVEEARATTLRLLRDHPETTAVFAINSVLAAGAFFALGELELTIPGAVSLMAYDDVPWMSMVDPQITTVSQHNAELGRRAAELLLSRLSSHTSGQAPPVTISLEPSLLVRRSVSRPRS